MNELDKSGVSFVAGLALGTIFFGGLWWTVRKGLTSDHPATWFLVSQVSRMAVTMFGFYFVADGQWQRLLFCLAGFLVGRVIVTRLSRIAESVRSPAAKETDYASESR